MLFDMVFPVTTALMTGLLMTKPPPIADSVQVKVLLLNSLSVMTGVLHTLTLAPPPHVFSDSQEL